MLGVPFLDELADPSVKRVLIAGAGGGFDFVSGVPLLFHLRAMGKEVAMANLTFSNPAPSEKDRLDEPVACVVRSDTPSAHGGYFPEKYFCQWMAEAGHDEAFEIAALAKTGARQFVPAFAAVSRWARPDAVVLVDGGTDSLLRGDEVGLGTPGEDMLSILAANELDGVPPERKYLLAIGFGVDAYHGVCHAHVLEAIADLTFEGAFLGSFSLLRESPEGRAFLNCVDFLNAAMPSRSSIVANSIASALEGAYGDAHRTPRTAGGELYINPLMSMYFAFRLPTVARRVLYLDDLRDTETFFEVFARIEGLQASYAKLRTRRPLPM